MKSLLLLVAIALDWPSGFASSEHRRGWWLLQGATAVLPITLLLAPTTTATSVGIRGGFGERQPGLEYDTEDPLFDLNVLITGVRRGPLSFVRSLVVHVFFTKRADLSGPFNPWIYHSLP